MSRNQVSDKLTSIASISCTWRLPERFAFERLAQVSKLKSVLNCSHYGRTGERSREEVDSEARLDQYRMPFLKTQGSIPLEKQATRHSFVTELECVHRLRLKINPFQTLHYTSSCFSPCICIGLFHNHIHSRSFLSFQTNFEFTAHGTLKSPYPLRRRQHREESRAEAPIVCGGDVERRVDVEEIMGLEENIQVLVGHPTGTR